MTSASSIDRSVPPPITVPAIDEAFCYITTIGRRTGNPHRIEIWFAGEPGGRTIYCLADGRERADWVANVMADPRVTVRVGTHEGEALGRVVAPTPTRTPSPGGCCWSSTSSPVPPTWSAGAAAPFP
jgi:deazaflavin-dependent oxidoreductase (nitroreductase family)